jgi:hypothetical protein
VVGPHPPAHEPDGDARGDHERVAEDRLAAEDRDDLRHDPEGREDQDVDLRVTEDPEQVLPQQRIRSLGDVEEVGVEQAVHHQQDQRHRDDRQGQDQQDLDHEDHPREHGQLHHRHARRPHVEDGHGQVDGADQRGDAGDEQAQCVEVDAVGRREHHAVVRGVVEPAAVRTAAEEPARVQEDGAGDEAPQREGVHPREGDVPGPDLQGQQVVGERGGHGHHDEEHHRHAVHGEHLVVGVGRQQVLARAGQLRPDHQGLDAADQEEGEGGDAVHDADLLVVDGRHPAAPARRRGGTTEDAEGLEVVGPVPGGEGERSFFGEGHGYLNRGSGGRPRAGRSAPRSARGRACPGGARRRQGSRGRRTWASRPAGPAARPRAGPG